MPEDQLWWDGFDLPIIDSFVNALTEYGNDVVVGGRFTRVAGQSALHVARWDGTSWHPLDEGTNGSVNALTAFEGNLIAGGHFSQAGDRQSLGIARWNGARWSALGSNLRQGWASSLTVYQGALIAGGAFVLEEEPGRTIGVIRWDGSRWSRLGDAPESSVLALCGFDGDLVAAGYFGQAGDSIVNAIARWDGTVWNSMGRGMADAHDQRAAVLALAVFQGTLIAGGQFDRAGQAVAENVAQWNGEKWQPIGEGLRWGPVETLVATDSLVAGGGFHASGDQYLSAHGLASWSGSGWHGVGNLQQDNVYALMTHDGALLAGTTVMSEYGPFASRLGEWSGSSWKSLDGVWSSRMHGLVSGVPWTLLSTDDGLIVGGDISYAGNPPGWAMVRGLGLWDGNRWEQLWDTWGIVSDAVTFGGDLVLGGWIEDFSTLPPIRGVARRHEGAWQPLGKGIEGQVVALLEYDGALVAGGSIRSAGDKIVDGVARWDGNAWAPVGDVATDSSMVNVYALAEYDGGLIAAGSFTHIGATRLANIGCWDGIGWKPLGRGIDGQVHALVVHHGSLYAAGYFFMTARDSSAFGLARWDGREWHAVGDWRFGIVDALVSHRGRLYAGGYDLHAGSPDLGGNILAWDDTAWTTLGSGIDGRVNVLGSHQGQLYVGGSFASAGGRGAFGIARWDGPQFSQPPHEASLELLVAAPNPFQDQINISYILPTAGHVELAIFDLTGRRVATLVNALERAGRRTITWDARVIGGRRLPAGVYLARLIFDRRVVRSRRLMLIP